MCTVCDQMWTSALWGPTATNTPDVWTQKVPTLARARAPTVEMAKAVQVTRHGLKPLHKFSNPVVHNVFFVAFSQSRWSVKTLAFQILVTERVATFSWAARSFLAVGLATSWWASLASTVWRLETGTIRSPTAEVKRWVWEKTCFMCLFYVGIMCMDFS